MGEEAQHQAGEGQAPLPCQGGEGLAGGGIQGGAETLASGRRRLRSGRQGGRPCQRWQLLSPPLPILFPARAQACLHRLVPGKKRGGRRRRPLRLFVPPGQVGEQDPHAGGIDGHHVGVDVQPLALLCQPGDGEAGRLTPAQIELLVGPLLPLAGQGIGQWLAAQGAEIIYLQHGRGRFSQRLGAVPGDGQAQHGVRLIETFQRTVQARQIEGRAVKLGVEVGTDAPQMGMRAASHPASRLHRGQFFHLIHGVDNLSCFVVYIFKGENDFHFKVNLIRQPIWLYR